MIGIELEQALGRKEQAAEKSYAQNSI